MSEVFTVPIRGTACLRRARVPAALLPPSLAGTDPSALVPVDIEFENGTFLSITPAGSQPPTCGDYSYDLDGGLVLPTLVDMHTHLDKGHISPRQPNPDGTFMGALTAVGADRAANWTAEDVRARMEFSLRCAFAHGTSLIRTHLDSIPPQESISWPVFQEVRADWRERIDLQAACLFGIDRLDADDGFLTAIADRVASAQGVLGAVTYMVPRLDEHLDAMMRAASDRGLDLDFHADETGDSKARSLRHIAEAAIRTGFEGRIVVGHCCSLARQEPEEIDRTLDLVARAGLGIVSLPMCNMYLQDRQAGRTPRWRGVTLLHEMKARGIPVAVSSDNTRDPFYAYGDLDLVEVYTQATRILQLDHPVGDWIRTVTTTPAELLGRPAHGRLREGAPANLVVFRARDWSELLARPSGPRTVLRAGRSIDRTLPDYRELDALLAVRPKVLAGVA
ncbi:cytosine deaminase [Pannonibacter tanglangensis]|uniref:Cytosine deaminase n=1 Tax=Pannonibacter tanglangensis TaxID=2750084 RepID=A0ABW9ZKG2_9HYPH|nr:cytosine deaminase [Pannonibacter sp. XCT-34]NBN65360.1 cytosine deaminase [Pannonibacter sp. XCT-34]